MKNQDQALNIPNPRLLSAVYFGLLSVVGTVLTNALLSIMNVEQIVPLFAAVIWGMIVASCTGAFVGELIVHCKKPYKTRTFLIGFFMVLITLPIFDLGILFLMKETQSTLFQMTQWHDFAYVYMVILGYSYILFGFLLAIASGLAAVYLRGQLVYDILDTYEYKNEKKTKAVASKPVKAAVKTRARTTH